MSKASRQHKKRFSAAVRSLKKVSITTTVKRPTNHLRTLAALSYCAWTYGCGSFSAARVMAIIKLHAEENGEQLGPKTEPYVRKSLSFLQYARHITGELLPESDLFGPEVSIEISSEAANRMCEVMGQVSHDKYANNSARYRTTCGLLLQQFGRVGVNHFTKQELWDKLNKLQSEQDKHHQICPLAQSDDMEISDDSSAWVHLEGADGQGQPVAGPSSAATFPCTPIRKAPRPHCDTQAAYPTPESMRPARPNPPSHACSVTPRASLVFTQCLSCQGSFVIPQGVPEEEMDDDEMDVDQGPELPSFKSRWEESQQRVAQLQNEIEQLKHKIAELDAIILDCDKKLEKSAHWVMYLTVKLAGHRFDRTQLKRERDEAIMAKKQLVLEEEAKQEEQRLRRRRLAGMDIS